MALSFPCRSRPQSSGRLVSLVLGLALAVGLAACHDDDDDDGGVAGEQAFAAFVQELFDQTADDTEPVPVEDREFLFDEDPAAFDPLLDC